MPVTYNDLNTSVLGSASNVIGFELARQTEGRGDLTTGIAIKIRQAVTGYRAEVDALADPEGSAALADLNTCILVAVLTP